MGKVLPSLPVVNYVNFNQTGSCISVGTSIGFDIINCQPFGKYYTERDDKDGGYSIVEMLFSTSLVALVGSGDSPHLSPRRLHLVNTKKSTTICEVTFPTTIVSVKLNRSRLVVMLKEQTYIYDIKTMKLLHVIENYSNPYGLISISSSIENNYLAYPAPSQMIDSEINKLATTNNVSIPLARQKNGDLLNIYNKDQFTHITLNENNEEGKKNNSATNQDGISPGESTDNMVSNKTELTNSRCNSNTTSTDTISKSGDIIVFDLNKLQPSLVIEAHKNSIATLALSSDGSLLATASDKGTIIRIFNVETGIKLYQFRRGTYQTKVFSMSFSADNKFLVVCCASKTVHIFKLGNLEEESDNDNDNNSDVESEDIIDADDTNSFTDSESNSESRIREPFVDSSRKTVGRMIRNSSQTLTRRAAKTLGQLLPIKVNSILEPSRHFASLKLPHEGDLYIRSVASIGQVTELNAKEYPELFISDDGDTDRASVAETDSLSQNRHDADHPATNPEADSELTIRVLPINVITQEGYLYHYVLDPDRGGDCLLLNQYSLLVD